MRVLLLVLVLGLYGAVVGAETRTLQLEDFASLPFVRDVGLSPDGTSHPKCGPCCRLAQ